MNAADLILAAMAAVYAVLILWVAFQWLRIRKCRMQESAAPELTVVVPFRNEAQNLPALLESLQHLNLSNSSRIILVDDHSTDNSCDIVEQSAISGKVQLLRLKEGEGKKRALDAGIRAAETEFVLCTDADCRMNTEWPLAMMLTAQSRKADMVCGPVAVSGRSISAVYQQLEYAALVSTGAVFTENGMPLMGNGANMLIRKSAYLETGGFSGGWGVAGGDDIWLMRSLNARKPGSVVFSASKDAVVSTVAVSGWLNVFLQRARWAAKERKLSAASFLVQVYMFVLHLLLLLLPAAQGCNAWYTASAGAKIGADLILLAAVLPFFGKLRLLPAALLMEPLQWMLVILTGILSWFPVHWKGRKL